MGEGADLLGKRVRVAATLKGMVMGMREPDDGKCFVTIQQQMIEVPQGALEIMEDGTDMPFVPLVPGGVFYGS